MVYIDPPIITLNEGQSTQLFCSATGAGASDFVYQWFLNREPVDGQNTSILKIDAVSVYMTGDYTCSVKNRYEGIGRSQNKATLILNGNCIATHVNIHNFYPTNSARSIL